VEPASRAAWNWRDISWLKQGTPRQQVAWAVLEDHAVLEKLARFDPVLAGTVPLGVDLPDSDLDIICEVHDASDFASCLMDHFVTRDQFRLSRAVVHNEPTTIATFVLDGFPIEVFGQAIPVDHQAAVVHLEVEHRLLVLAGESLRSTVRALKQAGLKTEPAFARALVLTGDPYEQLYTLCAWTDDQLLDVLEAAKVIR
jgi:Domain of unknown function (DUF4269)